MPHDADARELFDEDDDDACPVCGGEGFVDAYEYDPVNSYPGELEPCPHCSQFGPRTPPQAA